MSDLIFTINVVVPLFGVMGLGYVLARKNFLSQNFLSTLSNFCFQVTLPCTLFRSTYTASLQELIDPTLIGLTLAGVFASIFLLCLIVPRFVKDRAKASALIQGCYRSNGALFGLSLAYNLCGDAAVGPATLLLIFIIPVFNVSAVIILQSFSEAPGKKLSLRSLLWDISHNMLIIGSLIGIILSLLGIHLPSSVESTVYSLADTAIPLAMLALGGQFDFKKALSNLRYNLVACAVKLVILPLVMMIAAIKVGYRGPELAAIYVFFAAPTATASHVMAANMGSDGDLAGQILVSTTFFSVFTVFIGVFLLRSLGFI